MNADPTPVVLAADVEVPGAVADVADLLVLMEVLFVERLQPGLVGVAKARLRYVDLLEVLLSFVEQEGGRYSSITFTHDVPRPGRHTRVPWR